MFSMLMRLTISMEIFVIGRQLDNVSRFEPDLSSIRTVDISEVAT